MGWHLRRNTRREARFPLIFFRANFSARSTIVGLSVPVPTAGRGRLLTQEVSAVSSRSLQPNVPPRDGNQPVGNRRETGRARRRPAVTPSSGCPGGGCGAADGAYPCFPSPTNGLESQWYKLQSPTTILPWRIPVGTLLEGGRRPSRSDHSPPLGEPEKGDRSNLPERPEGCFAQIGPVPFFLLNCVFPFLLG